MKLVILELLESVSQTGRQTREEGFGSQVEMNKGSFRENHALFRQDYVLKS